MEPIQCSETSAYNIQTPGKYPENSILHPKPGEILKTTIYKDARSTKHKFLLAFWKFLENVFLEQLVGRGGPIYWPVGFLYLNSLALYLWGYPGSTVFVTEISDVQNTERDLR
jgi:hypothetical protein